MADPIFESSKKLWATCIPHLSVDNVVFGFHDTQLKVLLLQIAADKQWILPGGYVQKHESVDDAVKRVLKERTGADDIFLHQFATFGDVNRSEAYFKDFPDDLWHKHGILIKLDNTRRGGAHKAPFLYKFDLVKYQQSLKGYSW